MNRYAEMNARHQKMMDEFPLGAAFSDKQFNEMMCGWGLDPQKDVDKIFSIGCGCFIRKSDEEAFGDMIALFDNERSEAIEDDVDGTGFVYEMFLYELANHEYGYTGEYMDTLDALGYTIDEVVKDKKLSSGFFKACDKLMGGN